MLKIVDHVLSWLANDVPCFFCNSKQSVKYFVMHKGQKVPCCNHCILTRNEEEEDEG